MGDMKTPDFDDLLAAFDIPDMQVDPKAAIESAHDENEGQLKQSIPVDEDAQVPSAPDGVVSVIVKNIRTLDSCETTATTAETSALDKENHHSSGNGLHNGFLSVTTLDGYSKDSDSKSVRCEDQPGTEAKLDFSRAETIDGPGTGLKDSAFSQFSPISSAEEFEDDDKIEVDDPPHVKEESQTVFQANVLPCPTAERECEKTRKPGGENAVNQEVSTPDAEEKVSAVKTAGSQVINLKFANNTTVKATVISAASVQSASSAILKAANAMQQQTVVVPASSLANAKLVPKTVHLANLNLLPQTAQATSELRQVLSKVQQPIKQALITAASTQPAKKVSRVHVVAHSQNAVVETFNKVLSSVNPVPIYTPNLNPPTNANITIPLRGYKCLECGDSFALEKSLAQHYDRRSVRIEVTCNHCAKNLVFFNKCSLLSHARGHKDKGVVMQCSHLIMKPIPADQMIIPSSSNTVFSTSISVPISTSAGGTAVAVAKAVAGIPSAVIAAPANAPILPAMPLDEDPSKLSRHGMKCLECSETFLDEILLATHFQHAAEAGGQTCQICQMLLPNKCSFSSHLRIHQHKSPYTCPECGAICRSSHFQSHVTRNCLHYTRKVGYRCIHCAVVYADLVALKSHIQAAHCEIFYKCPICPMAFKSAPSTHSHAYTQHPGIKIGEAKIIYKCSMCDTVFTQQTLLCSHFDQHIAKQKVSVFKCPDCALLYAQKQLMVDHIKCMHGTLKSIEGPPNLGPQQPLVTKPVTTSAGQNKTDGNAVNGTDRLGKKTSVVVRKTGSRSKANNPGWMCQDCEEWFPEREDYISHMKKDHGKQMKKHPCRQCEKSFSSSHSLCRHNRIKHKGIRKVYTCWNCPDSKRTFTKRFMLEKHIRLMHGIKNPDVAQMTETTTVVESPKKEENKMPLPPKRKLEDAVLEFRPPPRGAITQPLKKLKINVIKLNKCAVCGYTTENVTQFQEHLPQHKTDGSTFQCRECGLCYTSLQSLTRHLFIVHKMKNAQQVARQNGAREENPTDSKMSLEDNQAEMMLTDKKCKVCSKTFESEGALNTHMRTHGMAFIKSKRLCASEK
ncbi:zinc finger protein 532 isoform X3 [Scyliorhinus torazame]|uniref:zinc finger protein 532 isoform X3 n=1 Tax=Scyliorhinus torazame TaxID=75743 RepID=UPI003B5AAD46